MANKENIWFLVFLIRIVAQKYYNDNQSLSYIELQQSGALNHFACHYDVLHTQSEDYVLDIAESFLKKGY
jgi:predicted GH43/DUF377 family glycosyl hydrolase